MNEFQRAATTLPAAAGFVRCARCNRQVRENNTVKVGVLLFGGKCAQHELRDMLAMYARLIESSDQEGARWEREVRRNPLNWDARQMVGACTFRNIRLEKERKAAWEALYASLRGYQPIRPGTVQLAA